MNRAPSRLKGSLLLLTLIAGAPLASSSGCSPRENESAAARQTAPALPSPGLPRLVDLGSNRCIPCKKMAPILEEIAREYGGVLNVEFIDVWKAPPAGKKYGIRLIPTQVFFDASGREVARHEGFWSKEDILAAFAQAGIALRKPEPVRP